MSKLALHWQIIIGLLLGIVWAVAGAYLGWTQFTMDWINPFGIIFINLLKLIAVPLVLFSIIKGVTDLSDINRLGNMGLKTLTAYLLTTVIAVTVGLSLVNLAQPGDFVSEEQRVINRMSYEMWVYETEGVVPLDGKDYLNDPKYSHLADLAKVELEKHSGNEYVQQKVTTAKNRKDESPLQFVVDMVPSNVFFSLANNTFMLQIIFFALFFGVIALMLPKEVSEPVSKLVTSLNEIFLKMVDVVMKAAPFFVFALLAGKISEMAGDDPHKVYEIFMGLGSYSLVVVLGLAFLVVVLYPLAVSLLVKDVSYMDFFKGISKAQTLAFSSSSSVATLPVTMECVNENLRVPKQVSSFILPIGATVNMDGTSLYISVAVVFLAQFHMVDLTLVQQLTIVLTATLASIGASAVPSSGLIMMIMVLQSVGLNPAWIVIIFPVDRILDMCRTVVNVTGDATVSTIISRLEKKRFPLSDKSD